MQIQESYQSSLDTTIDGLRQLVLQGESSRKAAADAAASSAQQQGAAIAKLTTDVAGLHNSVSKIANYRPVAAAGQSRSHAGPDQAAAASAPRPGHAPQSASRSAAAPDGTGVEAAAAVRAEDDADGGDAYQQQQFIDNEYGDGGYGGGDDGDGGAAKGRQKQSLVDEEDEEEEGEGSTPAFAPNPTAESLPIAPHARRNKPADQAPLSAIKPAADDSDHGADAGSVAAAAAAAAAGGASRRKRGRAAVDSEQKPSQSQQPPEAQLQQQQAHTQNSYLDDGQRPVWNLDDDDDLTSQAQQHTQQQPTEEDKKRAPPAAAAAASHGFAFGPSQAAWQDSESQAQPGINNNDITHLNTTGGTTMRRLRKAGTTENEYGDGVVGSAACDDGRADGASAAPPKPAAATDAGTGRDKRKQQQQKKQLAETKDTVVTETIAVGPNGKPISSNGNKGRKGGNAKRKAGANGDDGGDHDGAVAMAGEAGGAAADTIRTITKRVRIIQEEPPVPDPTPVRNTMALIAALQERRRAVAGEFEAGGGSATISAIKHVSHQRRTVDTDVMSISTFDTTALTGRTAEPWAQASGTACAAGGRGCPGDRGQPRLDATIEPGLDLDLTGAAAAAADGERGERGDDGAASNRKREEDGDEGHRGADNISALYRDLSQLRDPSLIDTSAAAAAAAAAAAGDDGDGGGKNHQEALVTPLHNRRQYGGTAAAGKRKSTATTSAVARGVDADADDGDAGSIISAHAAGLIDSTPFKDFRATAAATAAKFKQARDAAAAALMPPPPTRGGRGRKGAATAAVSKTPGNNTTIVAAGASGAGNVRAAAAANLSFGAALGVVAGAAGGEGGEGGGKGFAGGGAHRKDAADIAMAVAAAEIAKSKRKGQPASLLHTVFNAAAVARDASCVPIGMLGKKRSADGSAVVAAAAAVSNGAAAGAGGKAAQQQHQHLVEQQQDQAVPAGMVRLSDLAKKASKPQPQQQQQDKTAITGGAPGADGIGQSKPVNAAATAAAADAANPAAAGGDGAAATTTKPRASRAMIVTLPGGRNIITGRSSRLAAALEISDTFDSVTTAGGGASGGASPISPSDKTAARITSIGSDANDSNSVKPGGAVIAPAAVTTTTSSLAAAPAGLDPNSHAAAPAAAASNADEDEDEDEEDDELQLDISIAATVDSAVQAAAAALGDRSAVAAPAFASAVSGAFRAASTFGRAAGGGGGAASVAAAAGRDSVAAAAGLAGWRAMKEGNNNVTNNNTTYGGGASVTARGFQAVTGDRPGASVAAGAATAAYGAARTPVANRSASHVLPSSSAVAPAGTGDGNGSILDFLDSPPESKAPPAASAAAASRIGGGGGGCVGALASVSLIAPRATAVAGGVAAATGDASMLDLDGEDADDDVFLFATRQPSISNSSVAAGTTGGGAAAAASATGHGKSHPIQPAAAAAISLDDYEDVDRDDDDMFSQRPDLYDDDGDDDDGDAVGRGHQQQRGHASLEADTGVVSLRQPEVSMTGTGPSTTYLNATGGGAAAASASDSNGEFHRDDDVSGTNISGIDAFAIMQLHHHGQHHKLGAASSIGTSAGPSSSPIPAAAAGGARGAASASAASSSSRQRLLHPQPMQLGPDTSFAPRPGTGFSMRDDPFPLPFNSNSNHNHNIGQLGGGGVPGAVMLGGVALPLRPGSGASSGSVGLGGSHLISGGDGDDDRLLIDEDEDGQGRGSTNNNRNGNSGVPVAMGSDYFAVTRAIIAQHLQQQGNHAGHGSSASRAAADAFDDLGGGALIDAYGHTGDSGDVRHGPAAGLGRHSVGTGAEAGRPANANPLKAGSTSVFCRASGHPGSIWNAASTSSSAAAAASRGGAGARAGPRTYSSGRSTSSAAANALTDLLE